MKEKNDDTSVIFPTWFILLTILYFLSNSIVFGILSLINPSFAFPDVGKVAAFPIQFFAIRHIAFSFPLIYGLIKKDVKILQVMFSMFLVMSVLDVSLLFLNDYYIPVIGKLSFGGTVAMSVGGFFLPLVLALKHLSIYSQKNN